MSFFLRALMEIVSGMNSIKAELEEVIKISYGLNHKLLFAFLKIYCILLMSCMAITSYRQSSFAFTIIGSSLYVFLYPNGLRLWYASAVFFHLSLNGSFM